MRKPNWRPATEAEACSNATAFIEFARATAAINLAPTDLEAFRQHACFPALFKAFLGRDPNPTDAETLLTQDRRPDSPPAQEISSINFRLIASAKLP